MKKIILIPMILLLSLMFVNATLIDSEDFESYTPNVDIINMINISNGKWNCSTFYPSCTDGLDGDADGVSSYVQVQDNGDTQFLRIQSTDGDSTDYDYVYLRWDNNNTTINTYNNFTFSYDIKLFNYGCGDGLTNTLTDISNFRMPIHPARYIDSDLYKYISPIMMGYQDNVSSDVNTILGSVYDTTSNDRLPFNSTLSIEDGVWHSITNHYIFNSSSHLIRVDQYDNGVLANSQIGSKDYGVGWSTVGFLESVSFSSGICWDIGIDNINITEDELVIQTLPEEEEVGDTNCSTSCSSWTDPYYLKEEFNGSINLCGWATLEDVCFDGELERETTDGYYSAFKESDLLTESNSRYATISFDLKPNSVDTNGYLALSVYDEDYVRYIQFFLSDDMSFYNNEGGSSELVYSNVTNSTYKTVQLHLDFTNNDFDLWYDDVKVSESLGLSNNFYDSTNINGLRISSSSIDYDIDNVLIYSSDQNNELLPSDTVIVAPIDDTVSMCGLFYKDEPSCSVDSDCLTNSCKPNGKCNRFDMNYCDENGYTRGNKCFIGAVTYCVLNSTQKIILDNFLLFLVFIVILLIIVYMIFLIKSN